ncbi:hypothetical protein QOT17_002087 [Balamuthia mandrillaris]
MEEGAAAAAGGASPLTASAGTKRRTPEDKEQEGEPQRGESSKKRVRFAVEETGEEQGEEQQTEEDLQQQRSAKEARQRRAAERRQTGKQKVKQPSGRFEQTFDENADFGRTDYEGNEVVEGEERAEDEASLATEGVEVEPFNLDAERGEGYFEGGHFVFGKQSAKGEEAEEDEDEDEDEGRKQQRRRKNEWGEDIESSGSEEEPHLVNEDDRPDDLQADAWLQDVTTLATNKHWRPLTSTTPRTRTKVASSRRGKEIEEEEEEEEKTADPTQLKQTIVATLQPRETVREAIVRLGAILKEERKALGIKEASQSPTYQATKQQLDQLTGAAGSLMDQGWTNVYDYTKERVASSLPSSSSSPSSSTSSCSSSSSSSSSLSSSAAESGSREVQWEYKMKADGEIFGPYPTHIIQQWVKQGFFFGENVALIRQVAPAGQSPRPFRPSDTIQW